VTQSYGSKVERQRLPDYRNSKTGKTRQRKARNLKPESLVKIDRLTEKQNQGNLMTQSYGSKVERQRLPDYKE
jgi:hypothetical protein